MQDLTPLLPSNCYNARPDPITGPHYCLFFPFSPLQERGNAYPDYCSERREFESNNKYTKPEKPLYKEDDGSPDTGRDLPLYAPRLF